MSWRIQMNVCSEIKTHSRIFLVFVLSLRFFYSLSPFWSFIYLFFISKHFFFSHSLRKFSVRKHTMLVPVSYEQLTDKHSSNDESHICRPHQWGNGILWVERAGRTGRKRGKKGFIAVKNEWRKAKLFFLSNMLSFLFVFVIYRVAATAPATAAHWLNYV